MPTRPAVLMLLLLAATTAAAREPACTLEQSVGALALIELERAGRVSPASVDPARTRIETVATHRLARDRYRIVYRVHIVEHGGARHELLTVQEATPGACTAGHIEFFVASRDPAPAVPP